MDTDRDEAERALRHAVGDLERVLEYADTVGEVAFEEYPRALPELGELLANLRGVAFADVELEAGRREALRLPALEAWEIDGGPGGIYWELGTAAGDRSEAIVSSRRECEALGAVVFHTLQEWEAEQLEAERELEAAGLEAGEAEVNGLALVTAAERAEAAEVAELERGRDRLAGLEARVSKLERVADLNREAGTR